MVDQKNIRPVKVLLKHLSEVQFWGTSLIWNSSEKLASEIKIIKNSSSCCFFLKLVDGVTNLDHVLYDCRRKHYTLCL